MTVCPSFSGHFQGNDVGAGTPVLVEVVRELLTELLAESLAEPVTADADTLLLVSEDPVELELALEDVSGFDAVVKVSGDVVETDCELELEAAVLVSEVADAESVPELELEPAVSVSDEDELVPRLEVALNAEPVLELELDESAKVEELVLTDIERVLIEDVLPVAELELEELDESLGGPAEYTIAPAGWGMRYSPGDL